MTDNNPDGGLNVDSFALEDTLAKIRNQITSKLDNQKHLAIILSAVEENIEEQHNEKSPVAYFVSFLSLLDQAIQNDVVVDNSLATTTTYFLDIVFPYTPKPLLRGKFSEILTKLALPLTSPNAEAPLVRSTIGALESLLLAQDHQQWSSTGSVSPKRALVGLLELSFDPRPKVRRRAQEAVNKVLSNPPTSPSPVHIASAMAAEVSLEKLATLIIAAKANTKKNTNKDLNTQIIHCLQLITSVTSANSWPSNKIESLCDVLLEISKTSDQYLVSSAFSAFEGLFKSMSNIIDVERFSKVLDIIFDLKPSINDSHLAASWLAVIAKALESFSILSPQVCVEKLPTVIPIVSHFLSSELKDIYTSASNCLTAIVSQTIPDHYLLQPSATNGVTNEIYELVDESITFLSTHITSLLSIKYQHATKAILEFVTACILKLRSRSNPDFLSILEVVGQWRTNEKESFPHNKEAEDVISALIATMGPQVVLLVLPLNLNGDGSGDGRAWLLPLLRESVKHADLQFFKSDILPLVEVLERKVTVSAPIPAKIFKTIVDQIWSLLPHFCNLPRDLTKAFDDEFAAELSNLMYSKVDLRVPICHSLRLLVDSNVAYTGEDALVAEEFPLEESKKNLEYLSSKASNILSVLFNVYSSTSPDSRGFVLETIDTYLQVISVADLETTFNKVCGLLKTAMDDEAAKVPNKDEPTLSSTMMDLVVAMAKYVPATSHNALFSIFSSTVGLKDALLQKRSYRILSRLSETEAGKNSILNFISEIEDVLIKSIEIAHPSARSSRLAAVELVLDILPSTDLFFIPSILQEVIMSTKDTNERSRSLSYQILNKMGYRMIEGGVIENGKVPGFDPATPASQASLPEYFTMVSAGLAAQTPHMVSATITAVSCLVFEFKDQLPTETLLEIALTVELFLTHNSREIAKAAIGFVKVEVLSLPEAFVKANLHEMLAKLMRWSHEHKGHFKSKVKHIVERLIRKFGVEIVEAAIPEDDRKLVANIKKTRSRAKRRDEEEESTDKPDKEKKFVSAYEQALYDSDVSDDEAEEEEKPRGTGANRKQLQPKQFILNSEEPLNLLDRQTLAQISSSKPKKVTKKELKDKREEFKTKNGKLVFNDKEDPLAGTASGIDAYLDAVKQAPLRGQKNKLKWAKGKKGEDAEDWSDDEKKPKVHTKNTSRVSKPKQKFKASKKM